MLSFSSLLLSYFNSQQSPPASWQSDSSLSRGDAQRIGCNNKRLGRPQLPLTFSRSCLDAAVTGVRRQAAAMDGSSSQQEGGSSPQFARLIIMLVFTTDAGGGSRTPTARWRPSLLSFSSITSVSGDFLVVLYLLPLSHLASWKWRSATGWHKVSCHLCLRDYAGERASKRRSSCEEHDSRPSSQPPALHRTNKQTT